MPFTTIGVASDPPPPKRGAGPSPFNENVQAEVSVAAFFALICFSGENRVLDMSRLYEGQSPGAALASAACPLAGKQPSHAHPLRTIARIVFCESVPIR